jgi:hypothetical protein
MFPPDLTGDGLIMGAEQGAAIHLVHHTFRLHLGFCIPEAMTSGRRSGSPASSSCVARTRWS